VRSADSRHVGWTLNSFLREFPLERFAIGGKTIFLVQLRSNAIIREDLCII
jgi:hypothetical protein